MKKIRILSYFILISFLSLAILFFFNSSFHFSINFLSFLVVLFLSLILLLILLVIILNFYNPPKKINIVKLTIPEEINTIKKFPISFYTSENELKVIDFIGKQPITSEMKASFIKYISNNKKKGEKIYETDVEEWYKKYKN